VTTSHVPLLASADASYATSSGSVKVFGVDSSLRRAHGKRASELGAADLS
jgi:hypothetical protein